MKTKRKIKHAFTETQNESSPPAKPDGFCSTSELLFGYEARELAAELERRIEKVTDFEDAKQIFSEILDIKKGLVHQIRLSRLLLKTEIAPHEEFRFLQRRIRNWITRWEQHQAAAETMMRAGPYNLALTVRFARNYSQKECQTLTKRLFQLWKASGAYSGLWGMGMAEPDSKPVQRDRSFHFHASLMLPVNMDLPTLDAEVEHIQSHLESLAAELMDGSGRPALRRSSKDGRVLGLCLQVIYDLEGWILYCTKSARKSPSAFADGAFTIEDCKASFISSAY